jgi:multiple sugar transport system permease protein
LTLFCYYPGIAAIFTSFFDYKAGISDVKTWNYFANYQQIFANPNSLRHFGNMVLFLFSDVLLALIPPLIFAFFLTLMRSKKLSGILRTLLFIPGIIPGIASLLIWKIGIYGDYGFINLIVKAFGGDPVMFFVPDDYTNMLWLILMGFPFVGSYLIFYGAMMNIPSSYYEAAELDGISVFKRFIKIDIPLCLPQIKYVLIMTVIASIQNFSRVYITMGRTNNVISTPIVEMYMLMNGSERNYGLASAYATILFVILFGLTYISLKDRIKQK